MYGPPFSDNQKKFIFQIIGQFDKAKLKAPAPSCHFVFSASQHHFPKFLHFLICVFIGGTSTETVQFLIVIIFNSLADSSKQTVFLASLMLATTFFIYFDNGRYLFQFTLFNLLVDAVLIPFADKHGNKGQYQ